MRGMSAGSRVPLRLGAMITTSGRVSFITATASSRNGASTATTPPASSTASRSIARDEESASRIATRQRGGPFRNVLRIARMRTSLSGPLDATRVPRPVRPARKNFPDRDRKFLPAHAVHRFVFASRATDPRRDRGGT